MEIKLVIERRRGILIKVFATRLLAHCAQVFSCHLHGKPRRRRLRMGVQAATGKNPGALSGVHWSNIRFFYFYTCSRIEK